MRFDNGSEAKVRSAQLIEEWAAEGIERLLEAEERERVFRANTSHDRTGSEAVTLVFGTVVDDFDAHHDRLWISREQEGMILAAAEVAQDPLDLSPVAFRDDDGDLLLPLPAAVLLAKRIAERDPESVVSAVDAHQQDLLAQGYASLVELYKPGWDTALGWAGKEPKALPPKEMSPSDAFQELWDRLRGQGVRRSGTEEYAWWIEPDQLLGLGHLLAPVTRYVGRVTIRPLADGNVRLALDYAREPRALEPSEARNLALSLSQQQARMLAEVRDAADGAELSADHGYRTMKSLLDHGLVWESEVADEDPASEFSRGRFRLTDAGWRVLEHLGPRSIE